jgi:hypothetical protein
MGRLSTGGVDLDLRAMGAIFDVALVVAHAQLALGEGQEMLDFLAHYCEHTLAMLDKCSPEVQDVANAFLRHRRLTGGRIRRIIERRQALDRLAVHVRERMEERA